MSAGLSALPAHAGGSPLPRRLRAVPSEPPYDDEPFWPRELRPLVPQATILPLPVRPWQPNPADVLATVVPLDPIADPPAPEHRSTKVDAELRAVFGARRTPRSALPDPRERAAAAIRVLLEVLAGDRPARQVASWVSAPVLSGLEQHRVTPTHRRSRRSYLCSLHLSEPSESVAEVAAVVTSDNNPHARRRAVALRLEGREGRWTVTALAVG